MSHEFLPNNFTASLQCQLSPRNYLFVYPSATLDLSCLLTWQRDFIKSECTSLPKRFCNLFNFKNKCWKGNPSVFGFLLQYRAPAACIFVVLAGIISVTLCTWLNINGSLWRTVTFSSHWSLFTLKVHGFPPSSRKAVRPQVHELHLWPGPAVSQLISLWKRSHRGSSTTSWKLLQFHGLRMCLIVAKTLSLLQIFDLSIFLWHPIDFSPQLHCLLL